MYFIYKCIIIEEKRIKHVDSRKKNVSCSLKNNTNIHRSQTI